METKCNAAENYFRRVISLVAESGYNVSVSPGAEQKITVRKVTGDTGESSYVNIGPSPLDTLQFL